MGNPRCLDGDIRRKRRGLVLPFLLLFAGIGSIASSNSIPAIPTAYGVVLIEDWLVVVFLFLFTIGAEATIVGIILKPKNGPAFLRRVAALHLLSYPVTVFVFFALMVIAAPLSLPLPDQADVVLLLLAECAPVLIEYAFYSEWFCRRQLPSAIVVTPRRCFRASLVANLTSFILGVAATFPFTMKVRLVSGGQRTLTSYAKADQRTLATALEAYYVDHNAYPNRLVPLLTTPISYISKIPNDPLYPPDTPKNDRSMRYIPLYAEDGQSWTFILYSAGPDRDYDITPESLAKFYSARSNYALEPLQASPLTYDPTNGTVSNGDVYRVKQ